MKQFWSLGTAMVLASCALPEPSTTPKLDSGRAIDSGVSVAFDAGVALHDSGVSPGVGTCELLISQRCDYLERCGLISNDHETREACESFFSATWCRPTKWLARLSPAINTLRFDQSRAQACADAFDSRSCSEWSKEPEVCGQFLLPNAQLRQPCYDGYDECVEGVCRGVSCGDRRCRPLGLEGEDCREGSDCQAGLYCRSTPTVGVGVCSKPAVVGDACSAGACADGLTCLGQCVALPAVGGACLMGRCDSSGYCSQTADGGVCQARLGVGTRCVGDGQCIGGSVCDARQLVCVSATISEPAAACSEQQTCVNGLVCVKPADTISTCQQPHPAASPCTRSTDCQSHLACTKGSCISRGVVGAACETSRDCGVLLGCLEGRCRARPVVGQGCSLLLPCLWGSCGPGGADGGFQCNEPAGPGTRCAVGGDCASGRCEQGQCLAACTP